LLFIDSLYLQSIDKSTINNSPQLTILDLMVLLVLHSVGWKKPTESLIRNKIRSGDLTAALFLEAASQHTQVGT
jgi:hypothetical protein